MTNVTNDQQTPVGRPTFLTVLCILTFIGSGWGVISSTMGYFAANSQAAVVETARKNADESLKNAAAGNESYSKIAEQMTNSLSFLSPENLKNSALAGIGGAILCLLGAFMMWKLKKTGFYSYVAGTLVGIIAPIMIFGMGNIFALGTTIFVSFFGILFVVLYGLNLKYMK